MRRKSLAALIRRRPPLAWVMVSLLVGALLGGLGGWMAHQPLEYPKQFTVTGVVTLIREERDAFGFKPDPGTPQEFFSPGYRIDRQTEGADLLEVGAHVQLTVLSALSAPQIVLRVAPAPTG